MANWEATAAALQPLLPDGRPRLTQELLARPPFRFIHDIVSGVQRATGFPAPDLFDASEQDPRSMDKELKLRYLEKLCAAVSGALGQAPPARPGKIVAGLEPEATNALLQMLAAAATNGAKAPAPGAAAPAAAAIVPAPPAPLPAAAALPGRHGAAAGDNTGGRSASDSEEAAAAPVVFAAPKLEALLPGLARRVGEARAALAADGAAPGSAEVLERCNQVAAIALDAATLARCLEELRGSAGAIASEAEAWAREGDKLAARLAAEQRADEAAAAASRQRLAALDAQVAAAQQRLAAAGVRV